MLEEQFKFAREYLHVWIVQFHCQNRSILHIMLNEVHPVLNTRIPLITRFHPFGEVQGYSEDVRDLESCSYIR